MKKIGENYPIDEVSELYKRLLRADQLNILKWYVDAAFAVHTDFKSHTGMAMTMGQGAIVSMSQK